MIIEWIVKENETKENLKAYLKDKGVSRRMLAKVKFHGGNLAVNGEDVRVRKKLESGDTIHMTLPTEEENPRLLTTHEDLEIIYEDEYYLIVNKPVGVISVPSPAHRGDTMASRVKGYITRKDYIHKAVHVVTRLDRDTSGVMLFAKNGLAHSMMDSILQNKEIKKYYLAVVGGVLEKQHDLIDQPIARSEESIIERKVGIGGKDSLTEYELVEQMDDFAIVKVQLHTGRTHQIRVHFSHIGHPLVGDDLYGGDDSFFKRQALHCHELSYIHPFTKEKVVAKAPLPEDMQEMIQEIRLTNTE